MVTSIKSSTPKLFKFRLRTALVVPFVCQIAGTVGLVGYLSFRNGQEAVNKLASQIRIETASHVQRVMENYFTVPFKITHSNINALRLNQIKLQDKEAIEQYFFYQFQAFPLSQELYVGMPDGTLIYVVHKPNGTFIANTTSIFPKREMYQLDHQGKRGKLISTSDYDCRTRPWYKLAVEKRGQVWTDVYLFTTLQKLGITAAEPYYDEQGKLMAIFTGQFPLEVISDFLGTLKVSSTGQVFILRSDWTAICIINRRKLLSWCEWRTESV